MPIYQAEKDGQTYFFSKDGERLTKEQVDRLIEETLKEQYSTENIVKKKLSPAINFGRKMGKAGLDTIEEIKKGPIGQGLGWLFSSPDFIEGLKNQGLEEIEESPGPTPGIKSGDDWLDTFTTEGQRGIASKALEFAAPTRFDIGTLGLGLAAKPGLKLAAKAAPEVADFAKFLVGIGHEMGPEAGVLRIGSPGAAKRADLFPEIARLIKEGKTQRQIINELGGEVNKIDIASVSNSEKWGTKGLFPQKTSRELGISPRGTGTNPRAIKEAEKQLDTIVELVAAGDDKATIAEKLNLKPGTLDSIFKKHKIASKDQDIVDAVNKIAGEEDVIASPPSPPNVPPSPPGGSGGNIPPDVPEPPPYGGSREPFRLSDLKDLLGPFQRSMQSLGEMSFPLRQGRVALVSHPSQAPAVFKNMFKAAVRPQFADEVVQEISRRPFANIDEFADTGSELLPVKRNLYREAKLGLSDPKDVFPSNLAHQIPGISQLSKRSEAAYGAGADTLRANLFDQVLEKHGFDPLNLPDEETVRNLGNYVNTVTGYGRGGQTFEQATPLLQYGFYSPRYQKSMFDMMNPVNYTGLTNRFGSIGAKEMAKDVGKFGAATVGGLEGLDYATGDAFDFGLNPLDSDFLKVKIGNTRLDPLGGFAPMMRLGARTGHDLLQRGFGDQYEEAVEPYLGDLAEKDYNLGDEVERFGRSKLAPGLATLAADVTVGEGKNIVGEPIADKKVFGHSFDTPYLGYGLSQNLPLYYQDIAEIEDPETAAIAAPLGFFGVGTQTYEKKKKKQKTPFEMAQPKNPYGEVEKLYKELYK